MSTSTLNANFFIVSDMLSRANNATIVYDFLLNTNIVDTDGNVNLKESDNVVDFVRDNMALGVDNYEFMVITRFLRAMESNCHLRRENNKHVNGMEHRASFDLVDAAARYIMSIIMCIKKAKGEEVDVRPLIENDYFSSITTTATDMTFEFGDIEIMTIATKVFDCVARNMCNHNYTEDIDIDDLANTATAIFATQAPEYEFMNDGPIPIKGAKAINVTVDNEVLLNARIFKHVLLLNGYTTPVEWVSAINTLFTGKK